MEELELIEYFNETPEFNSIPEYYQNRIISFFTEDRHYFVDPSHIMFFLMGKKYFTVFQTINDVKNSLNKKPIAAVLGCNRNFDSVDAMGNWHVEVESLKNKDGKEINGFVMTHAVGFDLDLPEEWYIAAYV